MPTDLFNPQRGAPLNKWCDKAKMLLSSSFDEHRHLLSEWSHDFVDKDGKFARQFQETYRSSVWELYLHAVFQNLGFTLGNPSEAPDFLIERPSRVQIELSWQTLNKEDGPNLLDAMMI